MVAKYFFLCDTTTSTIHTLSLHDALPILGGRASVVVFVLVSPVRRARSSYSSRTGPTAAGSDQAKFRRSEEHTSELQSLRHLVCRLLLEKKKTQTDIARISE